MRTIKFRAWDADIKKILPPVDLSQSNKYWKWLGVKDLEIMQYTGIKDKNGLTEVYEGDIIDIDGNIIGNLYQNNELLETTTNICIQDFGGKTWCATYQKALERGLKNS